MKILVIGDAHVDERQNLDRFKWLGNYIAKEQPVYVVIIGDFLSMNCLSDWDRNKRLKMEGARYSAEIEAGNRALDLMIEPYMKAGVRAKRSKKKAYKPKIIYVEGNHEDRVWRYIEANPVLKGHMDYTKELNLRARGIHFVPYKQCWISPNGVYFTHVPIMANGKGISSPNVAQKALKLFDKSVVFGHIHTLDMAGEHRHGAPHLNQALCCGCFFEHVDDYAKGSMTNYWRGLVELNCYSENRFDISMISMSRLEAEYNDKKK